MSEELLPHYYFIPAVRDGLAAFISAAPAGNGERALMRASLTPWINDDWDTTRTVSKCVGLYGPGDVLGFDPSVIARTDPRLNVWDYEPNFMPLIEFSEPDLPWRFTPKPAAADGKLDPWITLIVLQHDADEFEGLGERLPDSEAEKKALPIRWISEVSVAALPKLEHAWMWAHVHVTAENGLEDEETHPGVLVDKVSEGTVAEGSHVVARLLCPRRLAPRTKYTAFVVPTFKIGRVAAGLHILGEGEAPLDYAWAGTETEKIGLPYYYKWDFATSVRGDFEYLVELLQPRPLPGLGKRRMDCADLPYADLAPCPGNPGDPEVLELEGALISPPPDMAPARWTNDSDEVRDFRRRLAGVLNLPAANLALGTNAERPPVTPPIFGRRHSGRQTVDAGDTDSWLNDVNLDPRPRAAAGFGALVVEKQQEALMASMWDQLGDIEAANEVLRHGELGLEASKGLFSRLSTLSMPDFLWTTAPLFGRVRPEPGSGLPPTAVMQYLNNSSIPAAAFDPAFRRMLRRGGGIRKRQGNVRPAPRGRDLLSRLNNGEIAAAGPPPRLDGMPSMCEVTDRAIRTLEIASEPQRRAANRFRIDGRVIARTTRRGVAAVRVEAWDRDPFLTDKLADAVTSGRGKFRIEFDPRYFQERFFDRRPDAFFKVFQGRRELKVTAPSVMRDVGAGDTDITVEVDMDPAPPVDATFRVNGTIIDRATQKGVAWITVEAWEKDVFRDDLIATAMTDEHGGFRIEFDESYFNEWSLDPEPDLYFKVYHRGRLIHSTEQSVLRNVKAGEQTVPPIQIDAPSPLPARPGSRVFDFCEEAITCDALTQAIAAAPSLTLHSQAANAICGALQDWLAPQIPVMQQREPADLTAVYETVKAAIAPWVTIPARVQSRIQIGEGVHQRAPLAPLESEVEFPQPMYEPLAAISKDLVLPGVETVPQNTISILATNRRFIESYMLGLNDALAGEALWRGAPVYLWTSFCRQFWDVSGLVEPDADPELSKDITRLARWGATSALGNHNPRSTVTGAAEQAVLLVRGDVLKRYPNTLVYAIETNSAGAPDWGASRLWPIFSGSLAPDLTFLGFDKSPKDLCKYYIVLEERLGEPRFGFDLLKPGETSLPELPTSNWWYELTWDHFSFADGRPVAENSYIDEAEPVVDDRPTPVFGQTAATTANICLQRPVRVAIHGSRMLSKAACA
jgi:hypothetical protein